MRIVSKTLTLAVLAAFGLAFAAPFAAEAAVPVHATAVSKHHLHRVVHHRHHHHHRVAHHKQI